MQFIETTATTSWPHDDNGWCGQFIIVTAGHNWGYTARETFKWSLLPRMRIKYNKTENCEINWEQNEAKKGSKQSFFVFFLYFILWSRNAEPA